MTCFKIMASSAVVTYMIFSLALRMASAASSFTCADEDVYPDPTNCHNFYECDSNLTPTLRNCMNGKGSFDAESKTCSVTPCSGSATFKCPGVGLYIDPTNCTNFYNCDEDLDAIQGTCLGGKGSFDNVTKTCLPSSCFNCVSSGFFADPDDCHSFYICGKNLIPTHSTCTSMAYFDPDRVCVFGDCGQGTATSTVAPGFTCTGEGYFADPKDCRWFYYCDTSFIPYHGICLGGGGYYDEEEVGCFPGKCSNKT